MKSYFKRNRFFLLCILFFATALSPIAAMDGAGMAFKVSLSGKIYRRFSFLVEEDIRPQSDFRQAEWFLTTGEVNYTFNRYFKTGIAYMLLCRYKASEELRNRYYVYASANYPVGNFTLSLRERFQSTYKTGGQHPKNYLRSMLTLSYKIRKTGICPFAYAEVFNDTGYQGRMHADRIRLSAGSDYKINKQNSLQLYYRYHIFNVYDPVNYKHAIGLTYAHRF
ncbi:DUF2490 domain-containing protein [Parabacteroides sp. BX2]|jgi:predicted porin|uniref:DUF2490 domain-containing protein n=1 Tax=Parabacteroides segnis TaxID=2763058 RepID=A0ABR7E009_9BACT|nr:MULTISPECIES: DUF2490 domain-containing protein [Parabacteroides]MBC5643106.1 DUF2490 domain-containing protein [Parabacteroides segnis]MCM0714879.1 DUF2490 domain-containing protein [Parabacteroides sp. TA-V-105]